MFLAFKKYFDFSQESSCGEGSSKIEMNIFYSGPFLMTNVPRTNFFTKSTSLHIAHQCTSLTHDTRSMHKAAFVSKSQMHFVCEMAKLLGSYRTNNT